MNETLLLYIVLMAVITYLTRFPMLFLSARISTPKWLERSLRMVPIGVFSSLTIPQLVLHYDQGNWNAEYLIAGIISLIIGIWKKQIYLSLFTGVFVIMILRYFIQ